MKNLFRKFALMEKRLAEEQKREPQGWIWVEGMDRPRLIDFDAVEKDDAED